MLEADFFTGITDSIFNLILTFHPAFAFVGSLIYGGLVLYRLVDFFKKVGFGKTAGWENDLFDLMLTIVIVGIILIWYETPEPFFGYSFTNLVTGSTSDLATLLDRGVMNNMFTHWQTMQDSFIEPDLLDFVGGGLYLIFTILLLLAKALTLVVVALALIFSAEAALFGPFFIPWVLLPAAAGYFKNWFSSFLQWSFLQVSAYGYLFIWEHYLRTYLTTLPTDIPPEGLPTYGMQATVVAIMFVIGLIFVGYFNHGLFAGGNSVTVLDRGPLRRYA